jgi:hypothetical protein
MVWFGLSDQTGEKEAWTVALSLTGISPTNYIEERKSLSSTDDLRRTF